MADRDYNLIVKEIIKKSDIQEVLDYYGLNYKTKGDELVTQCIFHGSTVGKVDKNPSLSVNKRKKVYNCWSCPASGNIVQLVMKCEVDFNEKESCSFHEALLKLCDICDLPKDELFKDSKDRFDFDDDLEEVSLNILETQTEVFNDSVLNKFYLKKHKYFENRGFTKEVLSYLEMGFGTIGEDADRCIFPIRNISGGLVGWTGRTVKNELPKWKHRPENRFLKAYALFNIDKAINHIIKTGVVHVVESPGNVARMIQHGIYNVVALLGSKMTQAQAELLKGYATKIILLYDPDDGGREGVKIAIERLYDSDSEVIVGMYDFGLNEHGGSIDIGDSTKEMFDSIKYVPMFEYIEMNEKVVDRMSEAFSEKDYVELQDGNKVLCSDKLVKGLDCVQVTKKDFKKVNAIESLFGISQLELGNDI